MRDRDHAPLLPGVIAQALVTIYFVALLAVEKQLLIIALLGLAVLAALGAYWMGWLASVDRSFADRATSSAPWQSSMCLAVAAFFHDNHFVLLLIVTVAALYARNAGLNIQFGYAGVLNFAGASFFGVGAYTSAVLNAHTNVPPLLVVLIGGLIAALIGSLLLLPVLRTRGHYAALVTIAFALLLKTFLEVNDVLGGPQGLQVRGHDHSRWSFNDNIEIGGIELSFYLSYFALSLALAGRSIYCCCAGWSVPGSDLISTRCGSTKPRQVALGSTLRVGRSRPSRLAISLSASRARLYGMVGGFVAPNNYHLRRFAYPGFDSSPRRHR